MHSIHGLPATTSEREYESHGVLICYTQKTSNQLFIKAFKKTKIFASHICYWQRNFWQGLTETYQNVVAASLKNVFLLAYQIRKNNVVNFNNGDIHNINSKSHSTLYFCLFMTACSLTVMTKIDKFLYNIRNVPAIKKHLSINLCIYGNLATSILKPKLLTNNRLPRTWERNYDSNRWSIYNYLVDFEQRNRKNAVFRSW